MASKDAVCAPDTFHVELDWTVKSTFAVCGKFVKSKATTLDDIFVLEPKEKHEKDF